MSFHTTHGAHLTCEECARPLPLVPAFGNRHGACPPLTEKERIERSMTDGGNSDTDAGMVHIDALRPVRAQPPDGMGAL